MREATTTLFAYLPFDAGALDPLIPWLATYALHSTLLLGSAWLLARVFPAAAEPLWRVALCAALATTTLAAGGHLPSLARIELAGLPAVRAGANGAAEIAAPHTPLSPSTASPVGYDAQHSADAQMAANGGMAGRASSDSLSRHSDALTASGSGAPGGGAGTGVGASFEQGSEAGSGARPTATSTLLWRAAALAWLLALLVSMGALAYRTTRFRWHLVARRVLADGDAPRLLADLARRASFRRDVRLTLAPAARVPMARGWLRPEICLPAQAANELAAEELEAALAHELAHLERRDPLWRGVARLVASAFPFQPLHRVACRTLEDEAELRCDDRATELTGRPAALARCLTRVAGWTAVERTALPALAASSSTLRRRVLRLLDARPRRTVRWWTYSVALAPALAVVTLAPSLGAAQPGGETSPPVVHRVPLPVFAPMPPEVPPAPSATAPRLAPDVPPAPPHPAAPAAVSAPATAVAPDVPAPATAPADPAPPLAPAAPSAPIAPVEPRAAPAPVAPLGPAPTASVAPTVPLATAPTAGLAPPPRSERRETGAGEDDRAGGDQEPGDEETDIDLDLDSDAGGSESAEIDEEESAAETSEELERALERVEAEVEQAVESAERALEQELEIVEQTIDSRIEAFEGHVERSLEPLENALDALADEHEQARERGDERRARELASRMGELAGAMGDLGGRVGELVGASGLADLGEHLHDLVAVHSDAIERLAQAQAAIAERLASELVERHRSGRPLDDAEVRELRRELQSLAEKTAPERAALERRIRELASELRPTLEQVKGLEEKVRREIESWRRRHESTLRQLEQRSLPAPDPDPDSDGDPDRDPGPTGPRPDPGADFA